MVAILVIGLVMALISAIFWCLESVEFARCIRALRAPRARNPVALFVQFLSYSMGFIRHLPKLWKLLLDVTATIFLTSSFGFGGLIGSIIGLTISNVISVYLALLSRRSIERSIV